MEAFREVVDECWLLDLGYFGPWYTWKRGNFPSTNIKERLDSGLAYEAWMELFPSVTIQLLAHSFFDHYPLLLSTSLMVSRPRTFQFRFESLWVLG